MNLVIVDPLFLAAYYGYATAADVCWNIIFINENTFLKKPNDVDPVAFGNVYMACYSVWGRFSFYIFLKKIFLNEPSVWSSTAVRSIDLRISTKRFKTIYFINVKKIWC